MIVRIAMEGQYRLAEDQLARLQELDAAVVAAAESGDSELAKMKAELNPAAAPAQLSSGSAGPTEAGA